MELAPWTNQILFLKKNMWTSVMSWENTTYRPTIFMAYFRIYELTFRNYAIFLFFSCVLAYESGALEHPHLKNK